MTILSIVGFPARLKPALLLPMPAACHFDHSADGQELRIRLTLAQFDAAVVTDFKKALDAAWKPSITRVILDLAAVELIDSSGVGALLSIQKRLPSSGEPVTLTRVRPAVAGVLQLLRLQRVFKLL